MPNLPRIYFDANETDDSGPNAYLLSIFGAQEDIQLLGDSIRPGMRVLLYMADELEVEATLQYNSQNQYWVGHADMSTLRRLV
jgi:hypothetical protein